MASCDWQKIKTPQEAKAMLRHCVTDERMKTEHANTEIDKNRTQRNVAFGSMSDYVESCERYDERLAELDAVKGANKRKDRVTLVGLSVPTPEGMSDAVARRWFADVYAHIEERFGAENVIGGTAHFDEVHEYKDAETGARRESRAHLHAYVVPVAGDKLNAKQVMSKANMIALNREVEEITRERYPEYRFMTGTKRKSKKSVETLKNESAEREAEARAQQIVADAQRDAEQIRADAQTRSERVLSDAKEEARLIKRYASKDAQIVSEGLTEVRALREEYERAISDAPRLNAGLEEYAKGRRFKGKDGTILTFYEMYERDVRERAQRERRAQEEREARERAQEDKLAEMRRRASVVESRFGSYTGGSTYDGYEKE